MHYYSQHTRMESPIHQPPPSPQQTTPKDSFVVDERWDGGDLFIAEPQIIKGHPPVEDLFKNLSISTTTTTEISPPLSSPLKCSQELFTSCFREDIDDAEDYFSEPEEEEQEDKQELDQTFVRYIDTPVSPVDSVYEVVEQEQDCDYLTSFNAIKDNTTTAQSLVKKRNVEEDDDLLIESVNDKEENNCAAVVTGPVSFEYYHASLVQHYKSILFTLSNDEELDVSTLPPIYKQYLVDLKQHMYSILPSTV